ncbi:MAG: SH3 domain-containing protein [Candidatus Krumholzibacteriia bacterium]
MTKDPEAPTQDAPIEDAPGADPSAADTPQRATSVQDVPTMEPARPAARPLPQIDRSTLHAEAERLTAFKSERVQKNNQTPCPACATLVHIDANLCPHCNTDIAANNALVRESVRRLEEINNRLGDVRRQAWHARVRRLTWPVWQTLRGLFADPNLREDLRLVIPALAVFFALVIALRMAAGAAWFWGVSLGGGFAAWALLGSSRNRRYVTLDVYRMALVFGLVLVMSTAVIRPAPFSGGTARASVTVGSSVVNIRQAATVDSRIVTTVQKGDRLTVIERDDLWYKVKTPDDKTGWVFKNLVTE